VNLTNEGVEMNWLIPFEKYPGLDWTYALLILWYLGLLFSFTISTTVGAIVYNEASNKRTYIAMIVTGCCGSAFFWWFTWLLMGNPIWDVANKLNQTL